MLESLSAKEVTDAHMKAALVLTMFYLPDVLESDHNNFHQFGHLDDVTVYCIPDKKTPREAKMVCTSLIKRGLDSIPGRSTCRIISSAASASPLTSCRQFPFSPQRRLSDGLLMAAIS